MKTISKNSSREIQLNTLVQQANTPMIISVSRKHSFGARWSDRVLASVKEKYQEAITIHTFYLEDSTKVFSMLGEERSMVLYFVKNKEIKASLSGSVAKSIFQKKLSSIIS